MQNFTIHMLSLFLPRARAVSMKIAQTTETCVCRLIYN